MSKEKCQQAIYIIWFDWEINYKGKSLVQWFACVLPQNVVSCVLDLGLNSSVVLSKGKAITLVQGRKAYKDSIYVELSLNQLAFASSLKVIIHGGATWNLSSPEVSYAMKWDSEMHIEQDDALLRWSDSHLCNNSRICHFAKVNWKK